MSFERLGRRWAIASGGTTAVDAIVCEARARVRRYPALVRLGYQVALLFVEWLGPFLVLGRPQRASGLADDAFELVQQWLCHHRWTVVRSLFMLFRAPLVERREIEFAPPPAAHPLKAAGTCLPPIGVSGAGGLSRGETLDFDVVVVGSGAGGAPLAWSLARRGARVAVVEAGSLARPASASKRLMILWAT